jgi:hypothetical protein
MTQPAEDPTLTAHIEARNAYVRTHLPTIDADQYLDEVLLDRAARYQTHVAGMVVTPDLAMWALAMSQKYGPYVRAGYYIADWITALLILRYGEEPDASRSTDPNFAGWPSAFTNEDRDRAAQLLQGTKRWPAETFTLLPRES